jgi:hypothetical protein
MLTELGDFRQAAEVKAGLAELAESAPGPPQL